MEKDLRRRLGWREAIIPRRRPAEQTAAPEQRSTRSLAEYAFLEDSRYASQPKNPRGEYGGDGGCEVWNRIAFRQ
jgi:hypothetical protein